MMLIDLDQVMVIDNPFAVQGSTSDPIGWITEIGGALWNDSVAIGLRTLFLLVGAWMILRVVNEFIDYGALIGAITGGSS